MNRRDILRGGIAIVVGTPIALNEEVQNPRDRLDAAIEELKAAASAFDPEVQHWSIKAGEKDGRLRLAVWGTTTYIG